TGTGGLNGAGAERVAEAGVAGAAWTADDGAAAGGSTRAGGADAAPGAAPGAGVQAPSAAAILSTSAATRRGTSPVASIEPSLPAPVLLTRPRMVRAVLAQGFTRPSRLRA